MALRFTTPTIMSSATAVAAAAPDRIAASPIMPTGPTQSPATATPRTPAASTPGRPAVPSVATRAWSPLTIERGT